MITLKNFITFDAKSNNMTRFVEGGLNTKKYIISEMLDLVEKESDNVVK